MGYFRQLQRIYMPAVTPPDRPRKPGVLVVDDMGLLLTLLKLELEPRGFDVWIEVDADAALDLYREIPDKIDLVLLDADMPGVDGVRGLAAYRRVNPAVRCCFMSSPEGRFGDAELLAGGAAGVVHKPFDPTDVARGLKDLLAGAPAGRVLG